MKTKKIISAMKSHADELEARDERHVYGPAIMHVELLQEKLDTSIELNIIRQGQLTQITGELAIERAKCDLLEARVNAMVAKQEKAARQERNAEPVRLKPNHITFWLTGERVLNFRVSNGTTGSQPRRLDGKGSGMAKDATYLMEAYNCSTQEWLS